MWTIKQAAALFPQQQTTDIIPSDPTSSPPWVGYAKPASAPTSSSAPGTPYSTGYTQQSDFESPYSPPMAATLLPGAPMTADLLILTEYLTSQFLQVGNNGTLPSDAQTVSIQGFLLSGNYSRDDMEAGFLHAVSIACKARTAFAAAVVEVKASAQADAVGEVQVCKEAEGFRAAFSAGLTTWEDINVETARSLQVVNLQRGVLQAYGAVAKLKVGILEVYKRQAKAMKGEERSLKSGDRGDYVADEDVSSDRVEAGSVDNKGDDRMEVDSAYEA